MNPKISIDFDFNSKQGGIWKHLLDFALKLGLDRFRFVYYDEKALNRKLWDFEIKNPETPASGHKFSFDLPPVLPYQKVLDGRFNEVSEKIIAKIQPDATYGIIGFDIFSRKKRIVLEGGGALIFDCCSKSYLNALEKFLKSRKVNYNLDITFREVGPNRAGIWKHLLDFALKLGLDRFRFVYYDEKALNRKLWDFEIKNPETPASGYKFSFDTLPEFPYQKALDGRFNEVSEKIIAKIQPGGTRGLMNLDIFSRKKGANLSICMYGSWPIVECYSKDNLNAFEKFFKGRKIKYKVINPSPDFHRIIIE